MFNRRRIYIDNVFFRMHYVWTVILLVAFALLVTSKMYIGDPINCMASQDLKDIVKQYCYIHSTFTRGRFEKGQWVYEPGELHFYKIKNLKLRIHFKLKWLKRNDIYLNTYKLSLTLRRH